MLGIEAVQGPHGQGGIEVEVDRELYAKSLLVIIIDVNPAQKYIRDEPTAFFKMMDSLVAFANTHVLLKKGNEVAIYAALVNQRYLISYLQQQILDKLLL